MLNSVVIQGRMVRDAELRQTNSGESVTSFTLAVDRDKKEQDGSKKADFIDCVAWRHNADYVCKYGGKGCVVTVEGRLQFRGWTDQNGNGRRNAEIQAVNVYVLGGKRSDAEPNTELVGFQPVDDNGDLPF